MTETPTLDEQISAVRQAEEACGGLLGIANRPVRAALRAARATLEGQRLPLLADPVHPPSADEREEARIRYQNTVALTCPPGHYDIKMLLRWLDAARLALTGAQAAPTQHRGDLFVDGEFVAHSGDTLSYKIECDALSDASIACLAKDYARHHKFGGVNGVPRGGLRLAAALEPYITEGPIVIADDVLTTGGSMEQARIGKPDTTIGVVIFARGPCPAWVTPLWRPPRGRAAGFADGAAQMRERAARLVDDHPDEEHPAIVDPEEIRGCCEVMAERIRSLPDRETGQ